VANYNASRKLAFIARGGTAVAFKPGDNGYLTLAVAVRHRILRPTLQIRKATTQQASLFLNLTASFAFSGHSCWRF
jgi:hypothetical protein